MCEGVSREREAAGTPFLKPSHVNARTARALREVACALGRCSRRRARIVRPSQAFHTMSSSAEELEPWLPIYDNMRAARERLRLSLHGEEQEDHVEKTKDGPMRTFSLPSGKELRIAQDTSSGAGTGAVVWDAAWHLFNWLCQGGWLHSCTSAIELGSGTGVVAIAMRLAGVPNVVATDGSQSLCEMCQANGRLNGVSLTVIRHEWGTDTDEIIAACGERDRQCSPLIVLSDLLYDHAPGPADALERSLRALIARGGCRMLVASWKARTHREESFMQRFEDLGAVLPTEHCADGVCIGALQLASA